jgi:hypothetical protein
MKTHGWTMSVLLAALLLTSLPSPAERNPADPYLASDSPFIQELYKQSVPTDVEGLARIQEALDIAQDAKGMAAFKRYLTVYMFSRLAGTSPPSYATVGEIIASPPKPSSQELSRTLSESFKVRRTSGLARSGDDTLLHVEMTNVRGITLVHPGASLVFALPDGPVTMLCRDEKGRANDELEPGGTGAYICAVPDPRGTSSAMVATMLESSPSPWKLFVAEVELARPRLYLSVNGMLWLSTENARKEVIKEILRRPCRELGSCVGSPIHFLYRAHPEYGAIVIACVIGFFLGIVVGRTSAQPARWIRPVFLFLLALAGAGIVLGVARGRELGVFVALFGAIFAGAVIGGFMVAMLIGIALGRFMHGR